jgi:hypothetical protein
MMTVVAVLARRARDTRCLKCRQLEEHEATLFAASSASDGRRCEGGSDSGRLAAAFRGGAVLAQAQLVSRRRNARAFPIAD